MPLNSYLTMELGNEIAQSTLLTYALTDEDKMIMLNDVTIDPDYDTFHKALSSNKRLSIGRLFCYPISMRQNLNDPTNPVTRIVYLIHDASTDQLRAVYYLRCSNNCDAKSDVRYVIQQLSTVKTLPALVAERVKNKDYVIGLHVRSSIVETHVEVVPDTNTTTDTNPLTIIAEDETMKMAIVNTLRILNDSVTIDDYVLTPQSNSITIEQIPGAQEVLPPLGQYDYVWLTDNGTVVSEEVAIQLETEFNAAIQKYGLPSLDVEYIIHNDGRLNGYTVDIVNQLEDGHLSEYGRLVTVTFRNNDEFIREPFEEAIRSIIQLIVNIRSAEDTGKMMNLMTLYHTDLNKLPREIGTKYNDMITQLNTTVDIFGYIGRPLIDYIVKYYANGRSPTTLSLS